MPGWIWWPQEYNRLPIIKARHVIAGVIRNGSWVPDRLGSLGLFRFPLLSFLRLCHAVELATPQGFSPFVAASVFRPIVFRHEKSPQNKNRQMAFRGLEPQAPRFRCCLPTREGPWTIFLNPQERLEQSPVKCAAAHLRPLPLFWQFPMESCSSYVRPPIRQPFFNACWTEKHITAKHIPNQPAIHFCVLFCKNPRGLIPGKFFAVIALEGKLKRPRHWLTPILGGFQHSLAPAYQCFVLLVLPNPVQIVETPH